MADPRLQSRGILAADIPKAEFSSSQISGLENIAASTANDAAKLQQTSEKLYLADFEKDARKAISEISERNKSDPENLKKDLMESYKGFSENAPFQLKGVMEAQYEIMGRPMINNALKLRTKINNDLLTESSLSNITESFKNLEMSASGMLSDDAHVAFDASRSAQLQMNTIHNMANLTGEDGQPLFSASKRVDLIEKAKQSLVGSGVRGWFDGQSNKEQAYKDFVEGNKKFKFYDEDGNISSEIDPLFEMNRGTFEKTRNYMEAEIKSILREQAKVQSVDNFQQKLDGSFLIDPNNKGDRKQVNTYFDNVTAPQLDGVEPVERNEIIVNFVKRAGVLPDQVKSILRSTMRNGSVENQAMSADLISMLQESKPQALEELDGKDVAYALLLTKNIRGGLLPEEAVAITQNAFNPVQADLVSLRKKDFRDLENDIDAENDLRDEFSKREWATLFINQTELPIDKQSSDQARIDYINIYENQYILTGDIDVAKDRATTIIGRQYGLTNISGNPRVMKYPPENYYAVEGLNTDWMHKQLVSDIKATTGINVTRHDIALVPDVKTAREVAAKVDPSYSVLIRNEKGEYSPVQKDNRLMRFKFDSSVVVAEHNASVKEEQEKMLIDEQNTFEQLQKGQRERVDLIKRNLEASIRPGDIS